MRVIAVGDLHGNFPALWRLLKAEGLADAHLRPTAALRTGEVRLVLLGDLVHPKTLRDYERLTGLSPYDPEDPTHLRLAAGAQIRELFRLKGFQEEAEGHVTILLGNHDEAALKGDPILQPPPPAPGVPPRAGGQAPARGLKRWMASFPRELVLEGVHFATWPRALAPGVRRSLLRSERAQDLVVPHPRLRGAHGYRFGVYGHVP